jgi:cation diffusion facilitator CzcD-associated flavoprotein CzcO
VTGKQLVPPILKDDRSVDGLHSSQVKDFTPYKGKKVVVVGAGASGLDLLTNTLRVSIHHQSEQAGVGLTWKGLLVLVSYASR